MTMFAVMDLKTTGLFNANEDRIVEIGVVILDEKLHVVRVFDSLVNPLLQLPHHIHQIQGIPVREIQTAPTFSSLIPELMECLAGTTHLVAHDVQFAQWRLQVELLRCGIQMPPAPRTMCTKLWAEYRQVVSDGTLPGVASALGIRMESDNHRAIVCAGKTAKILRIVLRSDWETRCCPIAWPVFLKTSEFPLQRPREPRKFSAEDMNCFGPKISPRIKQRQRTPRTPEVRKAQQAPEPASYGIIELPPGMKRSAAWTWYLFTRSKLSVSQIAQQRCMHEFTVYSHLEKALQCGFMRLEEFSNASQTARILSAWYALREENRYLRLFSAMHSDIPYSVLKCVIASLDAPRQQQTGVLANC